MNKSLIMLVSVLAVGFVVVFVINSASVMSTYYKYTSYPSFNCTESLEGITWNEKCASEHTRVFWYCNGYQWKWKEISCPFGYQCVGGHCKELPHEPAVKVGKFTLSKYSASPGETIYENLLIYNMGTAPALDKICTFEAKYSDIQQIKEGIYKDMMCYSLFIDGGGASKSLSYPVKVKNTTEIVGYAIYENNKLYTYNFFNIKLNLVKKEVDVSWRSDKYSALPGDTVTITYNVNVKTLPIKFYAHACIIPIKWKSSSIIKDFNYYNGICNNVVEKVIMGNIKKHFLDYLSGDFKRLVQHAKENFKNFPLVKKIITIFVFLGSLGFVGKFMGGMLAFKVFVAKIWSFLLAIFIKVSATVVYFFTDYLWSSWLAPIVEVLIFSWLLSWMEKVPFLSKGIERIYAFLVSWFEWLEYYMEKIFHIPMRRFLSWSVKKIRASIYRFIGYKKVSRWKRLHEDRVLSPNSHKRLVQKRKEKKVKTNTYISAYDRLKEKRN